MNNWFS